MSKDVTNIKQFKRRYSRHYTEAFTVCIEQLGLDIEENFDFKIGSEMGNTGLIHAAWYPKNMDAMAVGEECVWIATESSKGKPACATIIEGDTIHD